MTTPAVVYRHRAMRSLRARATMVVFWSAVEAIGHFGSATWIRQGLIRSLWMGLDCRRRCLHHGPLDDDAGGRVPPQGDEELACQGDDGRLAHPSAKAPDPLVEPQAERRGRLVLQP